MKPAYSALLFLIVIVLFGSPVISDRLVFDINPKDNEMARYYGFFIDSVFVEARPVSIVTLSCGSD